MANGKFEVYESHPPRLHVWPLRTQEDLENLALTVNTRLRNQRFRIAVKQGFREELDYIGNKLYLAKDGSRYDKLQEGVLYYDTYRSGYGDSVDTTVNSAVGIGGAVVLNYDINFALLLRSYTPGALLASQVPDFMRRQRLVLVEHEAELPQED